jgi:phage repressor protein C with HTH and peptisase S24 domain
MEIPRNGVKLSPSPSSAPHSDKIRVMGVGEGGEDGWSLFNGDVVEYIDRPPQLAGAPTGYSVYVVGTSMEPRYYAGEKLYVHPGKPVLTGSWVLVQAKGRADGEPPRAVIARFIRKTGLKLILGKLNPERQIEVPMKEVVSIHRIVGSGE